MSNNSKKPKAWINQGRIQHDDGSETRCPCCHTLLDGYTVATMGGKVAPDPPLPTEGQISACIQCGEILQFTTDAYLRKADPNALDLLAPEAREFLLHFVAEVKRRN